MNKPYGVPGSAGGVFPGPHGYSPIHRPHGYGPIPANYIPRVIVGPPVPRRPMMGFYSNKTTNVKLSKNDGLIVTGCTLIALGLILAFAAPHSLPIAIPILVVGLALVGLGIFFKTREEPKKPLAKANAANEKNEGKDYGRAEAAK